MITLTGTLLLVASLAASLPAHAAGVQDVDARQPAGAAFPRLSLIDVPYLSQTEALCGGAAAAMVLRYWGASGITAEDFAPLVDRARGGIETSAIARAVRERGYEAHAASGTAALAQRELANGRPVIALVEDRPGAFHYVVIVGWHERAVVLHDPARTPYVLMRPAEFERRWRASGSWMLAVAPNAQSPTPNAQLPTPNAQLPTPKPQVPDVNSERSTSRVSGGEPLGVGSWRLGVGSFEPGVESRGLAVGSRALGGEGCDALVADGVDAARMNDLPTAERLLADAAYRCVGAAPLRELAGVRLLQRRWPEVRDLAGRAVEIDESDTHAWRLLAAARYLAGDRDAALEAWNHAGEPVVDLVSVSGLQRTTHRSVERLLGIEAGGVLTREAAARAGRRLAELPAAIATRLEYVPRAGGRAEVRAHVVERHVVPRGALTWMATGLRAAGAREVGVPIASLGHRGERLDASWRFWPHRPAARLALHLPSSHGLFAVELAAERQPFDDPGLTRAEHVVGEARLADWATDTVRWELRGGVARWRGAGPYGTAGAAARFEGRRARAEARLDAWLGARPFAAVGLLGEWRSSTSRRGFVVDLSAAFETIGSAAPLDSWPAGDTGHARLRLLRAHPVLDDGRLRVDRLGRRLFQATMEAQHWWRPVAAVPLGAAMFVDAGHTSAPLLRPGSAGDAVGDVDIGAGFRLSLPAGGGLFRADIAHGVRDGRNAVSIGWSPR